MKPNAAPVAALLLLAALFGPLGLTSSAGCRRRTPDADADHSTSAVRLAAGGAEHQQPTSTPPLDALPPGLVPDWVAADAPRTYLPDDLHMLVDGGDGVYLRYGFVRAVRRTYRPARPANNRVRVELFAFSTPASSL